MKMQISYLCAEKSIENDKQLPVFVINSLVAEIFDHEKIELVLFMQV